MLCELCAKCSAARANRTRNKYSIGDTPVASLNTGNNVLEDPTYTTIQQQLLEIGGVPFDRIEVEVSAYPEKEWNELKADWEAHDCYRDDPAGAEANLARKEGIKLTYRTEYFFNISDFMGD